MIDESEEAPSNPQKKNQLISLFMAKLEELTNNPDQAKQVFVFSISKATTQT